MRVSVSYATTPVTGPAVLVSVNVVMEIVAGSIASLKVA